MQLELPAGSGTYFAFFIDDNPELMFAHPVRYAWAEVDSAQLQILAASQPLEVVLPGSAEPAPFATAESFALGGVTFTRGTGGFGPQGSALNGKQAEPQDGSHVPSIHLGIKRIALVLDLGGDGSGKLAKSADSVANYLENPDGDPATPDGYNTVHRISQHFGVTDGNNHNYLAAGPDRNSEVDAAQMRTTLRSVIYRYADMLDCLEWQADAGLPCHEFFLYITAHGFPPRDGGGGGGVFIHRAWNNGEAYPFTYNELLDMLEHFGPCVKVVVFIDACNSGQLIEEVKREIRDLTDFPLDDAGNPAAGFTKPGGAERACGWTLLTSCKADEYSYFDGLAQSSATTDWQDGATQDLDGDGKHGDFGDRWKSMEANANTLAWDQTPQRLMPDGQTEMSSTD